MSRTSSWRASRFNTSSPYVYGFVQLREREYDLRLHQFNGRVDALASTRIAIRIFTQRVEYDSRKSGRYKKKMSEGMAFLDV
jgi:hypothetical protein